MTRAVLAFLVAMLLCASAEARKLKVVATFSILGDFAATVGEDRIELRTLVGPDSDAHVYEPTPGDARAVAAADILVVNGLGFDTWAVRLAKSSGSRATIVTASDGVRVRETSGTPDPHAWHDPSNAFTYANKIALALARADESKGNKNGHKYVLAAWRYTKELERLDADIVAAFAKIPKARRRVITTHDAFGYLAAAYGVAFIAPLGVSTEEQPSAKGVARLITQIKREKIKAVFVENISDPRLIEQIARETGVTIGGKLYSDALSTKAGPASTYIAMMRHNVRLLTAAMAKGS
jgi:zinc/manganese transport system substrate-binding protein